MRRSLRVQKLLEKVSEVKEKEEDEEKREKKRRKKTKEMLMTALCSLPSQSEDFVLPISWTKRQEPRVPAFKVLRKNKYSSSLPFSSLSSYEEAPSCLCKIDDGGCGKNCQNFLLMMECNLNSCPCCVPASSSLNKGRQQHLASLGFKSNNGAIWCQNTAIQRADFPAVEVFETEGRGFGLRALESLLPYTIIAEYTGEVITEEECMKRMKKYKTSDCFYFASLGRGLVLDAKEMGSIARFANHHCKPNCELQKWNVNGETRVALVSIDHINSKTELCYNYQYCSDGLALTEKQRQPCFCGADCCAGTIGGRVQAILPSKSSKWIAKARTILGAISPLTNETDGQSQLLRFQNTNSGDSIGLKTKTYSVYQLKDHLQSIEMLNAENDCDNCDVSAIRTAEEYKILSAVVEDIEAWHQSHPSSLFVPATVNIDVTSTCDRQMLSAMIDSFPYKGLRFAAMEWVDKSLKAAEVGNEITSRIIQKNLNDGIIFESRSENSTVWKFDWDEFVAVVNQMDKALPIILKDGHAILQSYQASSKWSHEYLQAFLHLSSRDNYQDEKTARVIDVSFLVSKLPSGYSKFWKTIERLGKAYGHPDISPMFFVLCSKLEDCVTLYENRIHIKNATEKHKTKQLSGDKYQLHCLCQLPEEDGQYDKFVQCEACVKWFHLQCCNMPSKALHNSIKFYCPPCQLTNDSVGLSSYCYFSTEEWHTHCLASFPSKKSSSKGWNCPNRSDEEESNSMNSNETIILLPTYRAYSLDYMEKLRDTEALNCPIANVGLLPTALCPLFIGYCCRRQSPTISMQFLNMRSIGERLLWFNWTNQKVISTVMPSRMDLKLLLEQYLDLRLLRVCPPEVRALRRLIWGVTTSDFFLKLQANLSTKDIVDSVVNRERMMLQFPRIPRESVVPIRELQRLVRSTRKKLNTPSLEDPMSKLCASLSQTLKCISRVLEEGLRCGDVETAALLRKKLASATHYSYFSIDVTDEYAFARLLSLADKTLCFGKDAVAATDKALDSVERFCWCDGPDQGQMVMCDTCSKWFHCGCVGLSTKKLIKTLSQQAFHCIYCTEMSKGSKYEFSWSSKVL